ncbi:MAG: hypothetical protein J6A47_10355 [Bacilli bacterium]|jgi:hypothetical protein|nr:hypothetical protein [Bacilli bacterium]MBO6284804.1 hypothetical protein [Bacilli bacterium]
MANTPKKLSNKEIAWYVVASVIAVVGLVFLVFGIVGDHFPGLYEDNWIAASENAWIKAWSHLGYRWWGLILLGVAALVAIISLTAFAKEGDRDSERALRRQQRLAMAQEKIVDEQPDQITAA